MEHTRRQIVANRGYCRNCGQDLQSWSRHDFTSCSCSKGSFLDGGLDYVRYGGDAVPTTVYADDPFELVREHMYRGGYGRDRQGTFRYTRLKNMDDEYLEALLDYDCPSWQKELIRQEIVYRQEHNITIEAHG